MSATRFVIEGEWLGHGSSKNKIFHRTVHQQTEKRLRSWASSTSCITFGDGTQLLISVRDCKPHERVEEIRGYARLIQDCAHEGVSSVPELIAREAARKATGAAA